jgi:hypothetical protein
MLHAALLHAALLHAALLHAALLHAALLHAALLHAACWRADSLVAPGLERQLLQHVDQHLTEPTAARARVDDDLRRCSARPQ